MKVDVIFFKNVLNLNEEDFALYGEMIDELNELRKIKDFSLDGCALSYKDIVIEKIKFSGLFSLSERKYIKFIKKYVSILSKIMGDSLKFGNLDISYNYLIGCYENKGEILKRLDKLLELGICDFTLIPEANAFSYESGYCGQLYFEIDKVDNSRRGFFTDGKIEIKDQDYLLNDSFGSRYESHSRIYDIYVAEVEEANYVLQYTTNRLSYMRHVSMQIKDLMFDIDTLPTLEELQNGVFPESVICAIEPLQEAVEKKQDYVDAVYDIDSMNDMAKRLLSMCEYYTRQCELTRCKKEAKAIKQKICILKGLYDDICALGDSLTNECFENDLMDGKELDKALTRKKWDSNSHCCC